MSEARALTNFAGNAVATVLIGTWTRQFDREQAERVFAGDQPFNEATLVDDHAPAPEVPRQAAERDAVPA
jgi:aerobic C4-dicarboxylate transport protein